jgi:hypothetical protein
MTLVTQATQMFNNAFFPAVAKNLNESVFKKLDRLVLIGFVPLFVIVTLIVLVSMKLFGGEYKVIYSYLFGFGLLGALQAVYLIFTYVVSSLNKQFYKRFLIFYNAINFLTVAIYGFLIYTNRVSIQFILLALCINYSLIILMQRGLIKKAISAKID